MKPDPPWYAKQTGRWHKSLELALASDSALRRSLAWCIIATVGDGTGYQTAFGKLVGKSQSAISLYLRGKREISGEIADQISAAVAKHLGSPLIGMGHFCHPFEVGGGYSWVSPGDPRWEGRWAFTRTLDPRNPSQSELEERFPGLFP